MIKITFKDNKKKVVDFIIEKSTQHLYVMDSQNLEIHAYGIRKIEKIEKQVKDLTFQEMKKLEENTDFDIFDYIEYYDNDGYDIPFISEEKFDDYIDITAFVKGGIV